MRKGLWINQSTFVEADQRDKELLSKAIATRDRSIDFYSLGFYLPNPDPVLKKLGKDITVYRELLTDPHVSSCIDSRKAGVRSLLWEIDRKDEQGATKSAQAKFIEEIFADFDIPQIVSEILDAPYFGYQPMEIVWTTRNGKVLPQSFQAKPPEWFAFDSSDNHLLFRTKANWNGERVPDRKFLVPTHQGSYVNPYGKPLGSLVYYPVLFKKGGMKYWVKLAEKFGIPHLVGKHPVGAGADQIADLLDAMDRMVQDACAAIPVGSEITPLEATTKSASSSLFDGLLSYCNAEISKAILSQTLTTEIGKTGGAYAAAQTHATIRNDLVDADRIMVENVFNELIDLIVEFNFGATTERPRMCFYADDDVDKALAERDKSLAEMGQFRFTKRYFARAYGFADDDIEIVAPTAPTAPVGFAEGEGAQVEPTRAELLEQAEIDSLTDAITTEQFESLVRDMLGPVFDLIDTADSYDSLQRGMAALYPDLPTDELQAKVERALFVAGLWGRAKGRQPDTGGTQ
jgi:phage gp29-like protein